MCIAPSGDAYLALNNGDGTGNKPPTFKSIGLIKSNEGYPQAQVVLGDIDGDGRGDYGAVDSAGNVRFWRNGGTGDAPAWESLGIRFPDQGKGDIRGIRFEE